MYTERTRYMLEFDKQLKHEWYFPDKDKDKALNALEELKKETLAQLFEVREIVGRDNIVVEREDKLLH